MFESKSRGVPVYWPSARHFTEAIQCPAVCFSNTQLREMLPAVDRLGMPLVTSGQFAYVYKLKSRHGDSFAVRCFRGFLGDRDQRYGAIQEHLRNHPLPYLSAFKYETEGILVGGHRFPILSMNWIDGPTLDLYLEKMIARREVLMHLADEWIKLIKALHEAGIAHGDLQHGNVIVEHGKLCLVDHDGMFVPAMAGWSSSEVGHQHYQHPRRDADLFDSNLDNFSALVIYLTLISLAEKPDLWVEFHDENLIFSKPDFLDSASSTLFAKIKEIGPEHLRLATHLEQAAIDEAAKVPYLLDLVSVKSALPSWMNAPADLETKTKTREVAHAAPVADSRWVPWQAKRPSSSVPATPPSATVQTIFGPPDASLLPPNIQDPFALGKNTVIFAKEFVAKTFMWWYWGIFIFLKVFGVEFFYSLFVALLGLTAIALVMGFTRAQEVARAALRAKSQNPTPNALPFTSPSGSSWRRPAIQPASITTPEPIIGNQALSIYHRPDCDWVKQISGKNRIRFSSGKEALSAGYKACQVCQP